jgi:hypothetical protein
MNICNMASHPSCKEHEMIARAAACSQTTPFMKEEAGEALRQLFHAKSADVDLLIRPGNRTLERIPLAQSLELFFFAVGQL